MQLYGTPSKSGINLKKIISRKPSPSYESYETSQPGESSPDAIAEEIVKTIFGDVDSRVEELFKISTRLDQEEDESFQEEHTDEREENGENCETDKTGAQGVRYLRESDRDVSQTGEDHVSEALISRENATDASPEDSAEDSKGEDAARVRERRDADIGSKEYLTRKVSDVKSESGSEKISRENPSGPKIEKAREHLENGETLASTKKQIHLTKRSDENLPKDLRIQSSSTSKSDDPFGKRGSVEYSSIEVNPIVGARDLYGKISEDYQGASDIFSVGEDPELDKSKKRSGDASCGDENVSNMQELRNEKQDKDNKEVNLKEASFSDTFKTLRVLPWIRKLNRLRREAMNRETNENKAEKVSFDSATK
ncbi:hypothetical protein K0M31_006400 [Melipona bicolor]|uniref:Uncharacterized protein n=1 Tax=Melipona bicolor TaxID=60889 RepID=A0AA40FTY5_9HYME|nr:hypothetical protein K0M31_006400 [Melipona bicolor]